MSNDVELIQALSSEDERDRAFAVEDIIFEGVPGAIDILVEHLKIETSHFVKEVIFNNFKTLSDMELVEKIIPLLYSDDAYIRNSVIEILAEQDELAISYIRPLVSDENKDIRKFAIDILYQLKSSHSAELIAGALEDPDINMRITAVEYLGRLEARDFTGKINYIFGHTDNMLLRCTCLETMALIGDSQSVHMVDEVYSSPEQIGGLEMYSYLKFLGHQGNENHLPFVLSLIKEKGKVMAKEIINTIEGICERAQTDCLPQGMVAELAGYIGSEINEINKYELLVFLGQFKNPEIGPVLFDFAESNSKLISLGAIEGIGLFGNSDGIALLNQLKLKVEDEDLAEAIEKSIKQLSR